MLVRSQPDQPELKGESMSKSKAHLLAEKFSGKEIGEKQFTDVLDTIAVAAQIAKLEYRADTVEGIPDGAYIEILDIFDEEDRLLAAMLMADLAGFSFGRKSG